MKPRIFQELDPTLTSKEIIRMKDLGILSEWPLEVEKIYNGSYNLGSQVTHTPKEFYAICQDIDYYGYIHTAGGNLVLKVGNSYVCPIGDQRGWLGVIMDNDDNSIKGFPDFPLYKISTRLADYFPYVENSFMGIEFMDTHNISRLRIGTVMDGLNNGHYKLEIELNEVQSKEENQIVSIAKKPVKRIFIEID